MNIEFPVAEVQFTQIAIEGKILDIWFSIFMDQSTVVSKRV